MKLSELDAKWVRLHDSVDDSERADLSVIGVSFKCPTGADHRHFVPFEGCNPADPRGWRVTAGATFDALTLEPSILFHPGHDCAGWHGFITAGEVRTG